MQPACCLLCAACPVCWREGCRSTHCIEGWSTLVARASCQAFPIVGCVVAVWFLQARQHRSTRERQGNREREAPRRDDRVPVMPRDVSARDKNAGRHPVPTAKSIYILQMVATLPSSPGDPKPAGSPLGAAHLRPC